MDLPDSASLERTAATMEELTSTVRQNADNATRASERAAVARSEAEKGGNVVSRTIDAMSAIKGSSANSSANSCFFISQSPFQERV